MTTGMIGRVYGYAQPSGEFMDITEATANTLMIRDAEIERLRTLLDGLMKAVEPFADGYIAQQVDGEGWTSNIHRDPISTWFGPSEFRALTEAYTNAQSHRNKEG